MFDSKDAGDKAEGRPLSTVEVSWGRDGVSFAPSPPDAAWLDHPGAFGADSELVLLLRQLGQEACVGAGSAGASMDWESYYRLEAMEGYGNSLHLLKLPPKQDWRPTLSSRGGLVDPEFSIVIQGWRDPSGAEPGGDVRVQGAVLTAEGRQALLAEPAWRTAQAVAARHAAPSEGRSPEDNQRDWARIRRHAIDAKAGLTGFLAKTVVLTPQKIDIRMRKGGEGAKDVVEILPGFEGAPDRWLEIFDRFESVPERYEIPDGGGLVHVLLSDDARAVLSEVRRMPGRRACRSVFAQSVRDPRPFGRAHDRSGSIRACARRRGDRVREIHRARGGGSVRPSVRRGPACRRGV